MQSKSLNKSGICQRFLDKNVHDINTFFASSIGLLMKTASGMRLCVGVPYIKLSGMYSECMIKPALEVIDDLGCDCVMHPAK